MCYNEVGTHKILPYVGSIMKRNWGHLCNHLTRKSIFTLTSYNFCISTLHLKLEMTIYVIHWEG